MSHPAYNPPPPAFCTKAKIAKGGGGGGGVFAGHYSIFTPCLLPWQHKTMLEMTDTIHIVTASCSVV